MIRKIARKIRHVYKNLKRMLFADSSRKAIRLISDFPNTTISEHAAFEEYFSFDGNSHSFKLTIEDGVYFRKYCHILMQQEGELLIKSNVFFNNYCSINCLDKIEIGSDTLFGEGVKLYDHNHLFETKPKVIVSRTKFKTAPIIIGNNCWIGSNVTILKGVTIGDNVIIGANNLIYKSVPSNSIVKNRQDLLIETVDG